MRAEGCLTRLVLLVIVRTARIAWGQTDRHTHTGQLLDLRYACAPRVRIQQGDYAGFMTRTVGQFAGFGTRAIGVPAPSLASRRKLRLETMATIPCTEECNYYVHGIVTRLSSPRFTFARETGSRHLFIESLKRLLMIRVLCTTKHTVQRAPLSLVEPNLSPPLPGMATSL